MRTFTFIFIVVLMGIFNTADGQVLISLIFGDKLNTDKIEFGIDGGANLTHISHLDYEKIGLNAHLGMYFDIMAHKPLMIHTGIIVMNHYGVRELKTYTRDNPALDSLLQNADINRKITYYSVPILLKYRYKNLVHVEFGPQIALRRYAKDTFKYTLPNGDDLTYVVNNKELYNAIEFGITAGIGFKLSKKPKSMQAGVRQYIGLTDISKNGSNQKISSTYLFISIPIGVAKDEAID